MLLKVTTPTTIIRKVVKVSQEGTGSHAKTVEHLDHCQKFVKKG